MKKAIRMATSLILIILLMLPIMPISAMASLITDITENDKIISGTIIKDIEKEEKTICDATIEDEFADDSVIVVLKKDANLDFRTLTQADFPEIQAKNIKSLTKELEPLVQSVRKINNTEVMTASASTKAQVFEKLTASTGYKVEELQKIEQGFNQIIKIDLDTPGKQNVLDAIKILEKREDILFAQPNYIYTLGANIPDDTEVHKQWAIEVLELEKAWDITTGDSSVKVGVVDTGIERAHTDLDNNVNIILGRDFTDENNASIDPDGHGTKVAGIIGAEGDNAEGVTGICWDIQLINLRVFDKDRNIKTGAIAEAIVYATSIGIPILNLSIIRGSYNIAMLEVIENYQGLLICSAGNYKEGDTPSNDDPNYPSSYDSENIISVAATIENDQLRSDSYYGLTRVDLGAPGNNILTTTNDGETGTINRTSAAAPHVTGVAALLKSAYPSLTTDQIKRAILRGVDKVSSLEGKCVTGGRLNANNALRYAEQYYKIEYNANGGTGIMAETRVFYDNDGDGVRDTEREIRANTFTNYGNEFEGWHAYREYDNKWYYYNSEIDEYGWYTTKPSEDWEKYRFEDGATIYNLSTVLECDLEYVVSGEDTSTIDSTITFYAQWKKYYTIKYDSNGAVGIMDDTKVYYGVSTPTRENTFNDYGNEFDGWFAHRASDDKWRYQNSDKSQSGWYTEESQPPGWSKYRHDSGCTVLNLSSVAGDIITFHAQWKKYYTVVYKANGGTGSMDNSRFYCGAQNRLSQNAYTRTGYDFDCWYAERYSDHKWKYQNADGTQTGWYTMGEQPSWMSLYRYEDRGFTMETDIADNEIINLHAQWKKYFTVEYYENGGTGDMDDTKVYCGVSTQLRPLHYMRIGYTFDSWYAYRESDGKWEYRNPSDSSQTGWYLDGQQTPGWVKLGYPDECYISETSSVAGDTVRFYAQWKKHFFIDYNANGGYGTMTRTKVVYGESTPIRENTFTRAGFAFSHWHAYRSSDDKWHYRSADGGQSGWYVDGQQPTGWAKFPYYEGDMVSTLANNPGEIVTFYAQWEQAYIIQYDANGGEGTMPDTVGLIAEGNVIQLPECTFTNGDLDFGGWNVYDATYEVWAYSEDGEYIEWYPEDEQPYGYYKHIVYDQSYFRAVSDVPTTYILYAVWLEK